MRSILRILRLGHPPGPAFSHCRRVDCVRWRSRNDAKGQNTNSRGVCITSVMTTTSDIRRSSWRGYQRSHPATPKAAELIAAPADTGSNHRSNRRLTAPRSPTGSKALRMSDRPSPEDPVLLITACARPRHWVRFVGRASFFASPERVERRGISCGTASGHYFFNCA